MPTTRTTRRFVVLGAGAIGGVVGARLHQAGHTVVLVARGAHGARIASDGLALRVPGDTTRLRIPTVGHVGELSLRSDDVVLLCVKSQHTIAALDQLGTVAPPTLPIVCLQNGVENERVALRRYAQVYGVPVLCPAAHLDPGIVEALSAPTTGILDVGRWPSGSDALAEEIAAAFAASTFSAEARDDIARWKYRKLLNNLANAVAALCTEGDARGELVWRARREGMACLDAAGIDYASEDEDRARRAGHLADFDAHVGTRAGASGRSSTWQSLARGAGSVETEYLNGEIVLLGRLHGVPTPVNALLVQQMLAAVRDRRPPGSVDPADLLAALG